MFFADSTVDRMQVTFSSVGLYGAGVSECWWFFYRLIIRIVHPIWLVCSVFGRPTWYSNCYFQWLLQPPDLWCSSLPFAVWCPLVDFLIRMDIELRRWDCFPLPVHSFNTVISLCSHSFTRPLIRRKKTQIEWSYSVSIVGRKFGWPQFGQCIYLRLLKASQLENRPWPQNARSQKRPQRPEPQVPFFERLSHGSFTQSNPKNPGTSNAGPIHTPRTYTGFRTLPIGGVPADF